EIIYEAVDPNANIIFGAVIDDRLQGEVRITVIATGFVPEGVPASTSSSSKRVSPLGQRPATAPSLSNSNPSSEKDNKPGLDIPEFLQRRRPNR
ncbi:MAG: hypothetical protein WBA57_00630, partial [Elainellaceae cyanobacterium]